METMRADRSWVGVTGDPIEEYLRLRGEVTMLQARAAEVLATIDRDRLFEGAGYLTAAALVVDRTGESGDAARRWVAEARGLAAHPQVRDAFACAAIDRPRVAMLLAASRVSAELFARDEQVLVDTVAALSMAQAFRVLEYWRQAADREAAAADGEHLHHRRRPHLSRPFWGVGRLAGGLASPGGGGG